MKSVAVFRVVARAASLLAFVSAAQAEWVQPAFNPPVGSRWIIDKQRTEESTQEQGDQKVSDKISRTQKAEITYEAKIPSGYRVRYVNRGIQITGTSEKANSLRLIMPLKENVELVASTDENGVPVKVENVEDVRKAVNAAVDRLSAGKSPEFAATMRRVLSEMLNTDEKAAVGMLEDIPLLAVVQNAGLKPGEIRRSTYSEASGIGSTLQDSREMSLLKTNAETNSATVLVVDTVNPASIHAMLLEIVRRSSKPGEDTSEREKVMNAMVMSIVNRYEIDMVDGMSRAMRHVSLTSRKVGDYLALSKDTEQITLTPAP